MKTLAERYIYPPRCSLVTPKDQLPFFEKLRYIAQPKYNDSRCLIKILPNNNIELWNRHGEKFRNYTPPDSLIEEINQLKNKLSLEQGKTHLFDGGLLEAKHEAIKDTLVIWDILAYNDKHQIGTKYLDRYNLLSNITEGEWYYSPPHKKHPPILFGHKITDHLFIPLNFQPGNWESIWEMANVVNEPYLKVGKGPVLEGIVGKDPNGELEHAFREENNGSWMVKSRIQTGRHDF